MASETDKKLEQQINDLLSQRKQLEQEILDLKRKIQDEGKKSIADVEKLIKLDALRLNNVEKEEEVRKKINDINNETLETTTSLKDEEKSIYSGTQSTFSLTSKIDTLKNSILYTTSKIKEETDETKALQQVINDGSIKQLDFASNLQGNFLH